MVAITGHSPLAFSYRDDLHQLPETTRDAEVNLHGGFAIDNRQSFGQIYYGMPGHGIVRVSRDMTRQELIRLPAQLEPLNFHSTTIGLIDGKWRLILPANEDELVAVITLDGKLDYVLSRPEFEEYQSEAVPYKPTDTVLHGDELYIADGYGANYISSADAVSQQWLNIFGGKTEDHFEDGKFKTAHGINLTHHHHHLVIADRYASRLQIHAFAGDFVASHRLPEGAWPCGIDFVEWDGRWLAVVGCLYGPDRERPAPIYILDGTTFEVLSTLRPKEALNIALAERLHNVVWHIHNDNLFLICQSWNPGYYFVLERAA